MDRFHFQRRTAEPPKKTVRKLRQPSVEDTNRTTTDEFVDSDVMFVSEPVQVKDRRKTLPSISEKDQAKISRILQATNIDDKTKFMMLAKLQQNMQTEKYLN